MIASVTLDTKSKLMNWQMFLELCKNGFSYMHLSFLF